MNNSHYHRDVYGPYARPGASSYDTRSAQPSNRPGLEGHSPEVEQSDAHAQGDNTLAFVSLVIAIIGLGGSIGIGSAGLAIANAGLRLSIATAYYGAAGAAAGAAAYGTIEVTRYAAQQARTGIIATIRAAENARRQVQARAIAVNNATLRAANAAQSNVVATFADGSNAVRRQVSTTRTAFGRVRTIFNRALTRPGIRQEPVPVEMRNSNVVATFADGSNAVRRLVSTTRTAFGRVRTIFNRALTRPGIRQDPIPVEMRNSNVVATIADGSNAVRRLVSTTRTAFGRLRTIFNRALTRPGIRQEPVPVEVRNSSDGWLRIDFALSSAVQGVPLSPETAQEEYEITNENPDDETQQTGPNGNLENGNITTDETVETDNNQHEQDNLDEEDYDFCEPEY